jgi:hypothetical protein
MHGLHPFKRSPASSKMTLENFANCPIQAQDHVRCCPDTSGLAGKSMSQAKHEALPAQNPDHRQQPSIKSPSIASA